MSLTEKRLCFVPKTYTESDFGINDDKFLTCALTLGKVLTLEEFNEQWSHNPAQFKGCPMRVLDVYPTCWEMCPLCEHEVELETKFAVQNCPVCGMPIIPCNLCHTDQASCSNCQLERICEDIEENNYVIIEDNGEPLRWSADGKVVIYGSKEDAELHTCEGEKIVTLADYLNNYFKPYDYENKCYY